MAIPAIAILYNKIGMIVGDAVDLQLLRQFSPSRPTNLHSLPKTSRHVSLTIHYVSQYTISSLQVNYPLH